MKKNDYKYVFYYENDVVLYKEYNGLDTDLLEIDESNIFEISSDIEGRYLDSILFFIKKLKENYRDLSFDNLRTNLKTLKFVTESKENLNDGVKTSARYDFIANTMYLDSNSLEDDLTNNDGYNHELMHMATNSILSGQLNVGFYFVKLRSLIGLNEFTTQYLTNKNFGGRRYYFSEFDHELVERLASIIDEYIFIEAFFNGDSETLLNSLRCYFTDKELTDFILLIDDYYYLRLGKIRTNRPSKKRSEKLNKFLSEINVTSMVDLQTQQIENYQSEIICVIKRLEEEKREFLEEAGLDEETIK